jgi:hypothetical protein
LILFCLAGLTIYWRRSDDRVAILLAYLLVLAGLTLDPKGLLPAWDSTVWQIMVWLLIAARTTIVFVFLILFPNGHFFPKWSRWLIVPCAAFAGIDALTTVANVEQAGNTYATNPLAGYAVFGFLACWLFGMGAQVLRYRRTRNPILRQQTKWFVFGLVVAVLGATLNFIVQVLSTNGTGVLSVIGVFIGEAVLYYGGVGVFLLLAVFAILRYRLALLGAVFFVALLVLQPLLSAVFGAQSSTVATIISTAGVVALFNPARHRLQEFVDKRFYRLRVNLDKLDARERARHETTNVVGAGLWEGRQIGQFRIEKLIGKGGMGEVYKGIHPAVTHPVAVKILPPELAIKPELALRFEREVQIVTKLNHPNVVNVFEFNFDNPYYMVMDFLDGLELGRHIKQNGLFTIEEARPIVRDVAAALDYAHGRGIVHRDVKPANIMLLPQTERKTQGTPIPAVGASGRASQGSAVPVAQLTSPYRAVLMDFGIARLYDESTTRLTSTGMMGTIDYCAPEQIQSAKAVDHRADVYSLSAVVYQMLTGDPPFKGSTAQIVFGHLQQPPPDPRDQVVEIPEFTAYAMMRALSKDPLERFNSAGEFAAAL